jgi:predicted permease
VYSNLSVVIVLGAAYALAAWLFIRRQSLWATAGEPWGGVLGAVIAAVPLFGVRAVPRLSDEAGLAIGLLVVGTSAAMAGLGVELALEQADRRRNEVVAESSEH